MSSEQQAKEVWTLQQAIDAGYNYELLTGVRYAPGVTVRLWKVIPITKEDLMRPILPPPYNLPILDRITVTLSSVEDVALLKRTFNDQRSAS